MRNVRLFYSYVFVMSTQLFAPTVVLFFQDVGLSYAQILSLQSVFVVTIFLADVPTSVIADAWSRKGMLALAGLGAVGGTVLFYLAPGFVWLAVGEVLWGFCTAAIMGTDTAYVYDVLAKAGKDLAAPRVLTNVTSLTLAATGAGSIAGSILAAAGGLRGVFLYNLPLFAVGLGLALALEEVRPAGAPRSGKRAGSLAVVRRAAGSLIRDRVLALLAIDVAVLTAVVRAATWYFQPLLKAGGVPIAAFGLVFAAMNLATAFIVHLAPALDQRLGSRATMLTSRLAMALLLLGLALLRSGVLVALAIVALLSVSGIRRPLYRTYMSARVTTAERATVLSFATMAGNMLFVVLGPATGWAADHWGLEWTLGLLAALTGAFALLFRTPALVPEEKAPAAAAPGGGR